MATITIEGAGIMGERVVGEEGGEGDEAVFTGVGTIDRHTGTGIVTTENRYLPDDTRDADEAGRGALHREGLGVGVLHEGTTGPGVPPVQTRAGLQLQHSQLQ